MQPEEESAGEVLDAAAVVPPNGPPDPQQLQQEHEERPDGATPQEEPTMPPPADEVRVIKLPGDAYRNLLGMGFSENAVKKGFLAGCVDEGTCLQWIEINQDHPELNSDITDPTVAFEVIEKRKLSPEEVAAKVEELRLKIQEKKLKDAADERQHAFEAERQRIQMAKEMREAKEQREALLRERAYEEMRRQRVADAAAKEKIQIELAVDRLVRSGKTPEDARKTVAQDFERKKREQQEERAKRLEAAEAVRAQPVTAACHSEPTDKPWNLAAVLGQPQQQQAPQSSLASAVVAATPVFPEPQVADLPEPTPSAFTLVAQQIIAGAPSTEACAQCFTLLRTIISNILVAPLDLKKRSLKKTTNTFRTKIACMPHAVKFLMIAGFRTEVDEQSANEMFVLRGLVVARLATALDVLQQFN